MLCPAGTATLTMLTAAAGALRRRTQVPPGQTSQTTGAVTAGHRSLTVVTGAGAGALKIGRAWGASGTGTAAGAQAAAHCRLRWPVLDCPGRPSGRPSGGKRQGPAAVMCMVPEARLSLEIEAQSSR